MEFNRLVLAKLHSLFTRHGLNIYEQSKGIVRYKSDRLAISLTHDSRENSNILWVGRNENNLYMLDGNVMERFFIKDLKKVFKIPEKTTDDFVNNVFLFFMSEGEKLLRGDELALIGLENFNKRRSLQYTSNLVDEQNLKAANKAWASQKYSEVIKYLEKLNMDALPESLRQKYKIAQQRLGK